jgi:hypothetical protein
VRLVAEIHRIDYLKCDVTGAMPGTGNSSYAGYFKNTQTVGGVVGLYAEANTALYAKGIYINHGGIAVGGINGGAFL